jgi:hypothetical protein
MWWKVISLMSPSPNKRITRRKNDLASRMRRSKGVKKGCQSKNFPSFSMEQGQKVVDLQKSSHEERMPKQRQSI